MPKPMIPFSVPLTWWTKKKRGRMKKGIVIPIMGELLLIKTRDKYIFAVGSKCFRIRTWSSHAAQAAATIATAYSRMIMKVM